MKLPLIPNLTVNVVTAAPSMDAFEQAVAAAVANIEPATLHPVAPPDAGAALQPKALLAAIVRCYARQILGSSQIELILARETVAATVGLTIWPDADTIRTFRQHNRMAIQLCLATALNLLAMQRLEAGHITRFNPTHLAEEACRRLIMAMFVDSMDLSPS